MTLFLRGCLWALLLAGCAAIQERESAGSMQAMPMAAPQGPARRIVQQIRAQWPGRQESLLCVLELDRRHIAVAGLSGDGLSLFNLNYDGKTLNLEKSPLLPESVSPQFIVGDIQLAYWPLAELQKILPPGWRLEAGESRRRLYVQDQKRSEVIYLPGIAEQGESADAGQRQTDDPANGASYPAWPKTIELINYSYHYRLHITTISYDAIPE